MSAFNGKNWVRSLFKNKPISRPAVRGKLGKGPNDLRLEVLEDRITPADIVIDDFGTTDTPAVISAAAPPTLSASGSTTAGGVLGGEREFFVEKYNGVVNRQVTFSSSGGVGSLSTDNGATGGLRLVYDGTGDSGAVGVTTNGLGAQNLSASTTAFEVNIEADPTAANGANGSIRITAYTFVGGSYVPSSFTIDIPDAATNVGGAVMVFPYSSFSGANFANVGAIVIETVNLATAGDVTFDTILAASTSNLNLDKSGPSNFAVGDTISYTITVNNTGPNPATGVTIGDQLPASLQFVSSSTANGSYNNTTGIWTLASAIPNGGSATLTINALVIATGTISNYAQVETMDGRDPNSTPGDDSTTDDDDDTVTGTAAAVDFGDAPDTYGTLRGTSNGPRHIATGIRLGNNGAASRDTELNGVPSVNADGDGSDEDGVTNLTYGRGSTITIPITSSNGAGFLNAWFDLNQNGTFEDSERLLTNVPMSNGTNNIAITIPAGATLGATYARFRVSTASVAGTPSPLGLLPTGEVEDYRITIVNPADIVVTKGVDDATPELGQVITFTVTATNAGPSTANSVRLDDLIPTGLTIQGTPTVTQGSYDTGTGIWLVGTLTNGAAATLTVNALVTQSGVFTNTATLNLIGLTPGDDDPDNNSDSETVTVPFVDFGDAPASYGTTLAGNGARHNLVPTVPGSTPRLGTAVDAETNGPGSGTGTQDGADEDGVTFALSNNTLIINSPNTNGITITGTAGARVDAWIDFNADGDFTDPGEQILTNFLTTGVAQQISVPVGAVLPNNTFARFRISSAGGLNSTGLAPDGEVEDYAVRLANQADLSLTKVLNTAGPFNLNQVVSFTITVTNNATSPSSATGVTVADPLPAGLTFVSQTGGTGTYNGTTWTGLGTIAPGASVSVTFDARITASGNLTNYAQIATADQFDDDSTPNNGTPPTPTEDDEGSAGLTANATDFGDAPTSAQSGFANSYPTTLAQDGARHVATGLTLGGTRDSENNGQPNTTATGDGTDEDGVTFGGPLTQGVSNTITVNASAAGFLTAWIDFNQDGIWSAGEQIYSGTVNAGNNPIVFNVPLDAAVSYNTFARFRLTSAANAAQIALPTGLADDGEIEDYQITIRKVIDLELAKSVDNPNPVLGSNVVYTVSVTNQGPNDATNVEVTDLLPTGVSYVSDTAPGGTTYTPGTGLWVIGNLASGATVTFTITGRVDASGAITNFAQVTRANEFDIDSQPNNGTPPTPVQDDEDAALITVAQVDFGDAPNTGAGTTYPTTLAQNGARHTATGPTLGATRDGEPNGQPNATATGDGADEDGVTIGTLRQGTTNSITVNASAPGFLNAWIDFNRDGDWDDVGEQIATDLGVSTGNNTVSFTAPLDASVLFSTFARFRLTSATTGGTAVPTGLLPDGEVEDYQVTLRQEIDLDLTKTVDNPTPALGTTVQYTIVVNNVGPVAATGVTIRDTIPLSLTNLTQVSGGGTFDTSVAGQITWTPTGGTIGIGSTVTLVFTGVASQAGTFTNYAQIQTVDQFDIDSQPGNGTPPTVVEDDESAVPITVPPADFGDAPASYPVTLAQNGARHGTTGPTLGALRDAENDGQPSAGATGDDTNNTDDEDGVTTLNVTIGTNQTIQVNVAGGNGFLNAWIDFNQDGDWDDVGEQIFTNTPVFAGSNFPVVPLIPLTATAGATFARFRLTSATVGSPAPTGTAPDGEVEDYQITLQRIADYGDAPDTYGTTVGNSGAGHIALGVGPYLGTNRPDTEVDGVPTTGADGDDTAGTDDEDGVTIPNLFAGQTAAFTVVAPEGGRLDAFIDWNGDGDFNDAGERVTAAGGTLLTAGTNTLNVAVPANFVGGPNTYLRFRISSVGGLNPTGLAATGEVEDYRYTNSSIAGRVYVDNRLTGWQDAGVGSPPLAGVTVNLLDGTGTFITSTVTDANGNYLFQNLAPGNYQVQEVQPTAGNFFEGFDTPGSTGGTTVLPGQVGKNRITGIVLPIGTNSVGNNFGEIPPADPNGFVYNDLNANGVRDPGEPGIAGVTITIAGTAFAGTPIARPVVDADIPGGGLTRVTDANGFYEYAIMPPGVYTITEAANPPGFFDGLEQNADTTGPNTVVVGNDNFSNIELAPNPIRGPFNFGEVLPASVAGAVYQDGNRNGVRDTGDQPIAGVVITLTGTDFLGNPVGPITTTTDASGNFSFAGLRPGTYNVAEAQPQSFSQGTNAAGSAGGILVATDIFGQIILGSGTNATNYLFGEVNPLGTTPEPVAPPGPLPPLTTIAPGGISKRSFLSSTGTSTITGPFDPDYNALGSLVAGANRFLSTAEGEGGELVRTFDLGRGQERFRFRPFPGNPGGVRAVTADITGDGVPDTIAVPGPGTGARLIAYNGNNGAVVQDIQPFESTFTGGMFVASGDFNGDGVADLVVSADVGGGPRVKVIDGASGATLADFMGIDDASFRGGARVAVGDIDGDGIADLVVAAGFGGGPRVAVFDGASVAAGNPTRLAPDFFAFESTLRNGVFVAVGDIDGDGFGDIITGAGPGGGPRVLGFSGTSIFGGQPTIITDFFAGDQSQRGGVPVSALDVNSDGRVEIVTGSAPGGPASVKFFNPQTGAQLNEFFAERGEFIGGVFVG